MCITGANSGIGLACAEILTKLGIRLTLLCRNRERGQRALERLRSYEQNSTSKLSLVIADLTDLNAIDQAIGNIRELCSVHGPLTTLVHNAGLLPNQLELTSTGHELTVGAHLIGPMRLTAGLKSNLEAGTHILRGHKSAQGDETARVIWVSSGGMYTSPLNVDQLFTTSVKNSYDGVQAYAHTKRAQVELASIMHKRWQGVVDIQSMHPGWVDTPGLQTSLPAFWRWTKNRLRTAHQGADTIAWLCTLPSCPKSHFWFDREARSPYLLGNRPKESHRSALWSRVCEAAQVPSAWINDA